MGTLLWFHPCLKKKKKKMGERTKELICWNTRLNVEPIETKANGYYLPKIFSQVKKGSKCSRQRRSIQKGWEWEKRFGIERSSVRLENKVGKFVPWGGEVQVLKNKRPGDLSRGIVNWVKEFEFYLETNGMLKKCLSGWINDQASTLERFLWVHCPILFWLRIVLRTALMRKKPRHWI